MKTYGVSGDIAQLFLTSTIDEGEWSASRLDCLTSEEKAADAQRLAHTPSLYRLSYPGTTETKPLRSRMTDE
jgi:hypothetical protein